MIIIFAELDVFSDISVNIFADRMKISLPEASGFIPRRKHLYKIFVLKYMFDLFIFLVDKKNLIETLKYKFSIIPRDASL